MRGEVAVIVLLLTTLAVVLVTLYLRYRNQLLLHQERLAALEKGTSAGVMHALAPWSPRVYLLRGLLWSFAGIALIISLLGIAASTQRAESVETTLWRANQIVENLHLPPDKAREIAEKDREVRKSGLPFALSLLGLIPVGVGAAYLVFYYAADRRREET